MRSIMVTAPLCAFALGAAIYASLPAMLGKDLEAVHANIIADFPNVQHWEAADFAAQSKDNLVAFDVRLPEEFTVSHISGAQRVDPNIDVDAFMAKYGKQLKGRVAVFYCSVGYRSSLLAGKLQTTLKKAGAKEVVNIKGGLFNWHNQKMALVGPQEQATKLIHPYSKSWSKLIQDQESIAFKR